MADRTIDYSLTHLFSWMSTTFLHFQRRFEAKYFVSRLLSALEIRVRKLLHFMGREQGDLVRITARAEQTEVARWLEDIALLVMHGEFRVTPSANLEMVKMFSNVYVDIT